MPDNDMRLPGTLASPVRLNGHLTNTTLQGMSAYEVAVANGYTGTEAEWLSSLKGETGETPNIQVGNVSTGQPGTNASATMTGTKENPVLNITIPRGNIGATPNMTIGTVTTGEEGSQAQATITGTPENPVLNLTIPKGDTGNDGFDPVVEVTKDGNTATVSVTDSTHTTEVNIIDGYTPQKNVDYFDGHSPQITGAKSQGTTFIYSDGQQIGAIADGEDGYTPRKGVDYFDGHTPAISGEKIDDTTFIYADGVRIATVLDGLDGNSPVITTVKSGKTTSILADSVVIGTISDGADGHSPTITTTKSGTTTTILSDGTSIGTVSDGQDGHSPEITTNKVGKVLTILSDGQTIGTVSDGVDGQDAVTPTITTDKSGATTTIYSNGVAIGTVEDGVDGSTPVITATKSEGITTIKANGVNIATINDGTSGEDGYSPTASVSKSSGVSTLTVTDESGTTSVQISDGTGMIASDPNNDGNIVLSSVVGVQIDEEPTSGSINAISSGSVFDELSDLKGSLSESVDRLEAEINGGEVEKSDTLNISFTTGAGIIADSSNSLYGKTSSDSNLQYSDFVNIEKYESIDITMMWYHNIMNVGIVFYSDNVINNIPSNCIAGYVCHSGAETMTTETRHFTIPSGAKYFRTSFRTGYQFTTCTGNYVEHTDGLPKINDDIGQLQDDVGDLSYLETKEKSSLVNAVNEINGANDGFMTYMESLFNSFKTVLVDLFERTAYADMNAPSYVARLKQIIWEWNGAFPSDIYQKVQYVGATGTQFIMFDSLAVDTESELEKYTYEIDCCVDSSIGSGTKIIAGFGSDGGHWLGYNSSVGNMALGTSSGCYFPNGDPTEHTGYYFSVENGTGKVVRDDNVVITRESSAFSKPTKFCLFTASYQTSGVLDGNPVFMFSGNIYSFKMSYEGTPILDLVPCYRKSDSVIGFYDMIEKVFYVNSGTGTFTKGGDI